MDEVRAKFHANQHRALVREQERLRQVTVAEAETYDWWSDYLAARLYAIKCQTVMGKSTEEIAQTMNLSLDHLVRLQIANGLS